MNSLVKNSTIYLGSSVINKAIPFLLLPIITSYLTPEEYGLLSIFMIVITLYAAFVNMNMFTVISKEFHKVSRKELSIYIGNILILLLILAIVYFLLTSVIVYNTANFFSIPTVFLLLIPALVVMATLNTMNTVILRNENRAWMYGIFEISNGALVMASTILFLVVLEFGWYSQVLGFLVSGVVFSIVGFVYMSKRGYISFVFDKEKIKSILNISIPLIPHALGGVIIAASDRLFIEQMVSLEAVGLYAVGYSFGMIVMLFTDAFIKAWSPWFYKNLANPTDSKKVKIVKYTYVFIIGLFVLAGLISVVAEFMLPYFVDEKFYGASEFIFWVALGYAVRGVYQIFFPYLVHISRTSFLATSTVVAALVNLGLNYILIDMYGAIGAAYATVGAFAVSALLVFWYQQKNYYMPWFVRRKNAK